MLRFSVPTVAILLALAGPASAGEIQFAPSIQGAGAIDVVGDVDPYACTSENQNDAETLACPPGAFGAADAPSTLSLQAIPSGTPAGHWQFVGWEGCTHTASDVCTLEALEPGSVSFTPKATFEDIEGPTIGSVTETSSDTADRTVSFAFEANEGATFTCQIDSDPVAACTSGVEYAGVAVGDHTFTVLGTDASGNAGGEATLDFTIAAAPAPPAPKPPVTKPPPIAFPTLFPRVLGPNAVTAKVTRKRTFSLGRVRLRCPAITTPCRGAATLKGKLTKRGKPVAVARKRFAVRPSSDVAVRMRLSKRAAKALAAKRRMRVTATLVVEAPDVSTRKDVTVSLRAPNKR